MESVERRVPIQCGRGKYERKKYRGDGGASDHVPSSVAGAAVALRLLLSQRPLVGKWTGVQLGRLLSLAVPRLDARYVVFHCLDTQAADGVPYDESIDLVDYTARRMARNIPLRSDCQRRRPIMDSRVFALS